ncbi:hypothetical protein [Phaeobacter inhibens]|uniref:hypothetical protein n=1 Tax=Phaeobacter inhibens TaxID=221822 RepID=UPI0021A63728|nr:hypothetical protein [Phaeobacter inhibens]
MTDIDYSSAIRQEIENRGLLVSRDVALRAALRNFLDATFSSKGDQSDAFLLPRIEVLLRALVYRQFSQRETLAALKLSMDRLSGELLHEKSSALSAASVAATPSRDLVHEIVENVAAAFGSYEFRKVIWQHSSQSRDIQENYTFVRNRLLALSLEDLNPSAADVFVTPLWLGIPKPDLGARNELVFSKYLKHEAFEFWREWYQGFLDGKPLDWELQRRVALIDDAIWDAGPEAVATEIERIKTEFLAEKLPMAETIELNPETGKFRAIPIPVENAPYMSALLSQIGDALEDCLGGHNGLSDRSGDVKKLNRVLTKYRDDPQNAELTLTTVAGSLRRQLIETRELPPNEDNHALLHTVEEGVRGIRANHPEVAANREQLARQAFKTLAAEEKQVLEEALPILTAISEAELAEDFAQDIPELINDATLPLANGAPSLPGADAATRVFSRVSKMALLKDQYDTFTRKGAEWFDSDTRKTVQLAGLVGGGVIAIGVKFGPKLLELVQIGLRLLGVL